MTYHPHPREMVRCRACRAWWSIGIDDWGPNGNQEPRCPCGGEYDMVDWNAHKRALPVGKEEIPPATDPPKK